MTKIYNQSTPPTPEGWYTSELVDLGLQDNLIGWSAYLAYHLNVARTTKKKLPPEEIRSVLRMVCTAETRRASESCALPPELGGWVDALFCYAGGRRPVAYPVGCDHRFTAAWCPSPGRTSFGSFSCGLCCGSLATLVWCASSEITIIALPVGHTGITSWASLARRPILDHLYAHDHFQQSPYAPFMCRDPGENGAIRPAQFTSSTLVATP